MEIDIKKKLAKNWFKTLQDMVCFEIEEIENNKKKFISNHWKKNKRSLNLATSVGIVLAEQIRQIKN